MEPELVVRALSIRPYVQRVARCASVEDEAAGTAGGIERFAAALFAREVVGRQSFLDCQRRFLGQSSVRAAALMAFSRSKGARSVIATDRLVWNPKETPLAGEDISPVFP